MTIIRNKGKLKPMKDIDIIKSAEDQNFVFLKVQSQPLGGIYTKDIKTTPERLISACNKVVHKFGFSPKLVYEICGKIEARTFLMFCWHCKNLIDNHVEGLTNLIERVKSKIDREALLHHFFVVEIAATYVDEHKVIINVRKKEKGADLQIGEFKCECKIRMGYITKNTTSSIPNEEEEQLAPLAYKEVSKCLGKEDVSKQDADIFFFDSTRTNFGYLVSFLGSFNPSEILDSPPELAKDTFILYSRSKGGKWYVISDFSNIINKDFN